MKKRGTIDPDFIKPPYCGTFNCNACNFKEICYEDELLIYDWHTRRLKDFTLEDSIDAAKEGFCSICRDGRISVLSNDEDIV